VELHVQGNVYLSMCDTDRTDLTELGSATANTITPSTQPPKYDLENSSAILIGVISIAVLTLVVGSVIIVLVCACKHLRKSSRAKKQSECLPLSATNYMHPTEKETSEHEKVMSTLFSADDIGEHVAECHSNGNTIFLQQFLAIEACSKGHPATIGLSRVQKKFNRFRNIAACMSCSVYWHSLYSLNPNQIMITG
jgi:hypothetical protein